MIKYKGVKTLEVLEGADNYNSWIVSSLNKYIKSPALEIGAGTGNISQYFKNLKKIVLTDVDDGLTEGLRIRFKGNKNINVEVLDISKPLGKVPNKFSSIFLVNVLEHIKDDEKALRNIYSLLGKDGRVVMLVPAKKFAFTVLDKKLGHYRRYEKNELKEKLVKTGFIIERIEFFNIVGLLSWLIRDLINRDSQLKPNQVRIFDSIVPYLRKIEPKKGLPIGISLIAVGRKI